MHHTTPLVFRQFECIFFPASLPSNGCLKKMAPTCEKNVQIKLTPKNFLLIIFNVVYIEVNETRKKL
jgi:hypothetical protein